MLAVVAIGGGRVVGTAAVDSLIRGNAGKRSERVFFSVYAAALAAIIFSGFAPSFYLRNIVAPYHPLLPLRPEVALHGVLAGTFILMFPFQAWLIASNRRAVHAKTGNWGFALGVLMLPLGYFVAARTYHSLAGIPPNAGFTPAMVMSAPLPDLVALATLLVVAWRCRFDMQAHKRLMILIACGLSDPAISRLPLWGEGIQGILTGTGVIFATVLPLWAWDLIQRRGLHWATVLGSAILFGKLVGRLMIGATEWWAFFVAALPGFGTP